MLKIGWSSREITPTRPALLMGQMYLRIAREAVDPLTLTAFAIEGERPEGRAVWISCDLVGIDPALQAAVRLRLARRLPGLPGEAVILNATHTHDSLVTRDGWYPHPGGDVLTSDEVVEWIAERAADAAVEAWESRVPRMLAPAFGHAVVGHNRRAAYVDGRSVMYGGTDDPAFSHVEGYEDHSLDMLFVYEPDGRLCGMLLDIPCPSQVEEHLQEFSADYWHDIRVELRQRFGQHLFLLPLCGAAGDQSPHFLVYGRQEEEMRRRRGLTERQEIAARVGDAVARALLCTVPQAGQTPVAHTCRQVNLSPRRITQAERDWAGTTLAQALEGGAKTEEWWPRCLQDVIERFERGESMPPGQAELHFLRIGEIVLATNPFELFLDYGLRIKARSPAAQTFIVQLANGVGLYLPTARAARGGHYGAHPAVAPVGPEGGQDLVEASLAAIQELFAAAA
jgi:hypothetical protein